MRTIRAIIIVVMVAGSLAITLVDPTTISTSEAYAQKETVKEPTPAPAAYLKLPATKKAKAGRYFCIKPDTNCTTVKWVTPNGLDPIDPEIQLKDANVGVFTGDAGTYVVQAYGALAGQATDLASCTVTITGPVPPTPPAPPPVPPAPVNPLTAGFQAAYNLDTEANRATSLQFLQGVYNGMAVQSSTWTTIKTNGDALTMIKSVVDAPVVGLTATELVNLRKAIAAEMAKTFGTTTTTPITLTALTAELANIAGSLQGVK